VLQLPKAGVVAGEFADLGIPMIAVLGNHGYQCDSEHEFVDLLRGPG
jgi:hypothetical protein